MSETKTAKWLRRLQEVREAPSPPRIILSEMQPPPPPAPKVLRKAEIPAEATVPEEVPTEKRARSIKAARQAQLLTSRRIILVLWTHWRDAKAPEAKKALRTAIEMFPDEVLQWLTRHVQKVCTDGGRPGRAGSEILYGGHHGIFELNDGSVPLQKKVKHEDDSEV